MVEDDEKIRRVLRNLLEDDGFTVLEADSGQGALDVIHARPLALVTLDIQLGADNGLDVLRDIRKLSQVPVIMVTGRDDVIDRVVGLEVGADDYITKPFHVREVLARVHAVIRRAVSAGSQGADNSGAARASDSYHVDGLTVTPDRMEVLGRDGVPIELTAADLTLLIVLLDRPGRVLSRDQLMDYVGGVEWSPLDRTIDNQIARLRKKVERNPSQPNLIKTVRGVGYMLAQTVERRPA